MSLETFSTSRLLAERLRSDHLSDIRTMDQNELFMAKLGGVRDEAASIQYLERNLAHWAQHGFGLWVLRDRASGTPIGRAVLRHLQVGDDDEVEVGYGFMPDYWGRGLATEITLACLEIARDPLGLESVVAITLPSNVASQRVMEKAGLQYQRQITHEGVLHVLFRTPRAGGPSAAPPRRSTS
ncbi:MAG TPA: GNAT family N-acetyltransferase [Gemmatimonadales bacterium]